MREPPASSHKTARPKSSPLQSRHDAIEAIDLTGGLDQSILSSGTSGTIRSGEPRGLWTEEVTPREKRGKKRKSDEYTSDLLSPSKHVTKVRSPAKATQPPAAREETVLEHPTTSRQTAQTLPPNAARRSEYYSPVVPRSHRKQVIADSDDDDEDLFNDWVGEDTHVDDMVLDTEESLYPMRKRMTSGIRVPILLPKHRYNLHNPRLERNKRLPHKTLPPQRHGQSHLTHRRGIQVF